LCWNRIFLFCIIQNTSAGLTSAAYPWIWVKRVSNPFSAPQKVTSAHGVFRKNFFPSFSSDGEWLTFVSDRNEHLKWELYGIKTNTIELASDSSYTVQLTDTGGLITRSSKLSPSHPEKPLFSWSPNETDPRLAIVLSNGNLGLLGVTGPSYPFQEIDITGGVTTFDWSFDGNVIALSSAMGIHMVDTQGSITSLISPRPGDVYRDISWLPTNRHLTYSVYRNGLYWKEIIWVDQNLEYLDCVPISRVFKDRNSALYRHMFSIAPVITPQNELLSLVFDTATPRIIMTNLSTLVE
jgi:hypothetical protein